jgi:hypothetical protein
MTHTNSLIKSKWLRSCYAHELFYARILRRVYSENEWKALRFGIETGFWAIQKSMIQDGMK